MSRNATQLLLLADHIKLSLLERQRAGSLNLPSTTSQDGQISRSLDSLQSGIEALESENSTPADQLERLKTQYSDLQSQFRGSSDEETSSPNVSTTTTPNDPALSRDFAAAQQKPTQSSNAQKSVRFRDNSPDVEEQRNRTALFPYRDNPNSAIEENPEGPDQSNLDNTQIHAYHSQVLRDQDDQLDRLGQSIGRQRELSIAIGDELDGQALLLDEVDERVDRHQGQLDRAKGRLGRVAKKARENWSLTVIVVLIVVLVLLIIVTKR